MLNCIIFQSTKKHWRQIHLFHWNLELTMAIFTNFIETKNHIGDLCLYLEPSNRYAFIRNMDETLKTLLSLNTINKISFKDMLPGSSKQYCNQ